MSLEDEVGDVVRKAMMGRGMDEVELCERAGVSREDFGRVMNGEGEEEVRRVARELGLDGDALWGLKDYEPDVGLPTGVRRLELPFHEWSVNAWCLEAGGERLLFDTGWRGRDAMNALGGAGVDFVFTTHGHEDHVGGNEDFEMGGVKIFSAEDGLKAGVFSFENFEIEVVDLAGHAWPAAGYLVNGLERQVFVVGDAVFAGSMGRCRGEGAYEKQMQTVRAAVERLNEGCVILPGHGPATTWELEMLNNPFFGGGGEGSGVR